MTSKFFRLVFLLLSIIQLSTAQCGTNLNNCIKCECSRLYDCFLNQRMELDKTRNSCSNGCAYLLGSGNSSVSVAACMNLYETVKGDYNSLMDKCINDVVGNRCVGNGSDTASFAMNSTLEASPVSYEEYDVSQKLDLFEKNPLLKSYKKCYKTCLKRSPQYATNSLDCYLKLGCQTKFDKATKKLAKNNCKIQTHSNKRITKSLVVECFDKETEFFRRRNTEL